jgi:hypothetical protein
MFAKTKTYNVKEVQARLAALPDLSWVASAKADSVVLRMLRALRAPEPRKTWVGLRFDAATVDAWIATKQGDPVLIDLSWVPWTALAKRVNSVPGFEEMNGDMFAAACAEGEPPIPSRTRTNDDGLVRHEFRKAPITKWLRKNAAKATTKT